MIIIKFIVISLIIPITAEAITIPEEPRTQVTPFKGSLYMTDETVMDADKYCYSYGLNPYDFHGELKKSRIDFSQSITITLEVYNPYTNQWVATTDRNKTPTLNESPQNNDLRLTWNYINLGKYFDQPFLGHSKYRFVFRQSLENSNPIYVSKEFVGPEIVVNFKNEKYDPIPGKGSRYNYYVQVRSSKHLLPIRLYVIDPKDETKWIQYGLPQTYNSANTWKLFMWKNVKYFKAIEFVADIK